MKEIKLNRTGFFKRIWYSVTNARHGGDKMTHRYIVNPILFLISGFVSAMALVLAVVQIYLRRPGSALVFFVLYLLFTGVAVFYSSVVEVDKKGVRRRMLGRTNWERRWDQIDEVGVLGTRVFHGSNAKNVGSLYFYFSDIRLDENARFEMALKWPPKKECFLLFRYDWLRAIQMLWDSDIATYNVADLSFGEGLADRQL